MNQSSHILIVDDNPENLRVLGTVLRSMNYRVTIAQSAINALKVIEKQKPDLILLDVMMPEMNGFQFCETLKNNPKTQDIEVIFVTAAVAQSYELKGLELGAIDYIYKPFSIPIIQAKITQHLERLNYKKELSLKNIALEEIVKLRDDIERISRHDLKTPLNAILGYPQIMLADNTISQEHRQYLEEILRAGNEMLNMINNSLDLFKMETGRYIFQPEQVDIVSVINTVIKDLKLIVEEYQVNISISQEPTDHGFFILGEKNLCYSLFANLVRNAIEASSKNDLISILMRYQSSDGVIDIINPKSVPEEIRDTFFDKYTTAGKSKGTGLGTYSAKLMTETQHGSISMTTNEQETCVTVRLPYKT